MIRLDRLADALAGIRPVQVALHRCLPACSSRAACDRCQAICPNGAILLAPTPAIGDCRGCGLCAAVCPTEALLAGNPSDHQLLRDMAAEARRSGHLIITCREQGIHLTCPGRVTPELLLAAVAAGAQQVELVCPPEACAQCRYGAGLSLARKAVETASLALGALGRAERVTLVATPSARRPQEVRHAIGPLPLDQDRRQFLLAALGVLRQEAASVLPRKEPKEVAPPEPGDADSLPYRRALLLWALERLRPAVTAPLLWPGRRPVLSGACCECGICIRLCQTGALTVRDGHLAHTSRSCLGCGLCAGTCPVNALTMDEGTMDLSRREAEAMGAPALLRCCRCGSGFSATVPGSVPEPFCLVCQIRKGEGEGWLA